MLDCFVFPNLPNSMQELNNCSLIKEIHPFAEYFLIEHLFFYSLHILINFQCLLYILYNNFTSLNVMKPVINVIKK